MKLFRDDVEHALRNPRYLRHHFMMRKEYFIPMALKVRDASVVVLDRATVRTALVAASASPDEVFQMREKALFPNDNWWIEIDPNDWDDVERVLIDKANEEIAKLRGEENTKKPTEGELTLNLAEKLAIHVIRKNGVSSFNVWFKASDDRRVFNPLLTLNVSDALVNRDFVFHTDTIMYGVWYTLLMSNRRDADTHRLGHPTDDFGGLPTVTIDAPGMRLDSRASLLQTLKVMYSKDNQEEREKLEQTKQFRFNAQIVQHTTRLLSSVWRFVTALTFLWSHRRTRRLLTASNGLTGAASTLEAHDTHKYVTLDLPRLLNIGKSEPTGMGPKKREHEVETHWCHSRKNPGKRWIRRGHMRGDPSLGRVTRTIVARTDLH